MSYCPKILAMPRKGGRGGGRASDPCQYFLADLTQFTEVKVIMDAKSDNISPEGDNFSPRSDYSPSIFPKINFHPKIFGFTRFVVNRESHLVTFVVKSTRVPRLGGRGVEPILAMPGF